MESVLRIDPALHAELNANIQLELNLELNRLRTGQEGKAKENVEVHSLISSKLG
jgi:hypothetical protein